MSVLLGCILGTGLLLAVSPFLWRADRTSSTEEHSGYSAHSVSMAPHRFRLLGTIRGRLALAGLGSVPPTVFLMLSAILALTAGAVTHAALSIAALSYLASALGALVPFVIATRRAQAKLHANRTAWPDIVDHLVSAVRSGLALPDSVSTLSYSGPTSTLAAFAEFESDYRATGNFSRCLDRLKDRLADPIADRVLETLRMAREVGGNDLTVVLRSLAVHLRQEAAIRAEVQARQGWIMNAARLGVAAPWIVLVMLGSRPEAAQAYNTPSGVLLIAGGLVVSLIAYRLMLAVGRLPEDKRWFA